MDDLREQIAAYLKEQLIYLVQEEMYYLQEGLGWAIRRIRGEALVEEDFEPEPSESLDEFLARKRSFIKLFLNVLSGKGI